MNDQQHETQRPGDTAVPSKDTAKDKKPKNPPIEPALRSYFQEKPVPVGPFFKSVRDAKLDRFTAEDLAAASALAAETDATGVRLLQLAAQSGKPKPVERWVWTAVQSFLKARVPAAFEPFEPDADGTFRCIHRELQRDLGDTDPKRRQQAEILLAMCLAWLASQRSLNVVATLEHLSDTFPGSDVSTREVVRRAIAEGKITTLKRVGSVATLLGGALRDTRSTLNMERQRREATEVQLSEARTEIAKLAEQLEVLRQDRDRFAFKADEAAKRLDEGRQHAGHDIADIRAQQNAFLKRRIGPLLSDAIDALEIEPPVPEIAIARLKSAMDAIGDITG